MKRLLLLGLAAAAVLWVSAPAWAQACKKSATQCASGANGYKCDSPGATCKSGKQTGTCTDVTRKKTGLCDCVCWTKKSSSSYTKQEVDSEAKALLRIARKRAKRGEKFTMTIPVTFTLLDEVNEVTWLDPYGQLNKRQTATTGGAATIRIEGVGTSELKITISELSLEGPRFSFAAKQPRVSGTLDVDTGVFQVRTQMMGMQTPETRLTFEWLGSANGQYDFDTGQLQVMESGVGSFLAPIKETAVRKTSLE